MIKDIYCCYLEFNDLDFSTLVKCKKMENSHLH